MAGDWIKFEIATPDKPEVWQMAQILGIDPDAVVGKLLRVWIWFDQHSSECNAPSVTKTLLDRQAGVTGFTDSMLQVGWMLESGGFITLPNFDRHNGKTAKKRAANNRRVAEFRKNEQKVNKFNSDVTLGALQKSETCNALSVTKSVTREEKRREEKINNINMGDLNLRDSDQHEIETLQDLEIPPQEKPEPKAKAVKKPEVYSDDFLLFWQHYPLKKNKPAAWKAWKALKPDENLVSIITSAISQQQRERDDAQRERRFCPEWPHPATWLNGRRFEDEPYLNKRLPDSEFEKWLGGGVSTINRGDFIEGDFTHGKH